MTFFDTLTHFNFWNNLISLKMGLIFVDLYASKVWTFWEGHIIWKNIPHGYDVYQVNQLICQNH